MTKSSNSQRIATIAMPGDYISAQGNVIREWDVESNGSTTRWAEIDLGNKVVSGPLITQPNL
jgi:hypothetical protein